MQRDGLVDPPVARAALATKQSTSTASSASSSTTPIAPGGKVVYLAPLKALCAERKADWTHKFARLPSRGGGAGGGRLRVVCVTGDEDVAGSVGGDDVDDESGHSATNEAASASESWSRSAQQAVRQVSTVMPSRLRNILSCQVEHPPCIACMLRDDAQCIDADKQFFLFAACLFRPTLS